MNSETSEAIAAAFLRDLAIRERGLKTALEKSRRGEDRYHQQALGVAEWAHTLYLESTYGGIEPVTEYVSRARRLISGIFAEKE